MTGGQLQDFIIDFAHLYGWKVAHFRSVRQRDAKGNEFFATPVAADGKGFPDLVLVPPPTRGHVLFREIKGEREQISAAQAAWGEALVFASADYDVWRPSDLPEIKRVLSFGRAS